MSVRGARDGETDGTARRVLRGRVFSDEWPRKMRFRRGPRAKNRSPPTPPRAGAEGRGPAALAARSTAAPRASARGGDDVTSGGGRPAQCYQLRGNQYTRRPTAKVVEARP